MFHTLLTPDANTLAAWKARTGSVLNHMKNWWSTNSPNNANSTANRIRPLYDAQRVTSL